MEIKKVYRKDLKAYRYKIDVTIEGRRIRRADFETKDDAKEAIAALTTAAARARFGMVTPRPKVTVGELLAKAREDKELIRRVRPLQVFEQFASVVGEDTELTNLKKAHWKDFEDTLNARKLKGATINRYLSHIGGILSSASVRFKELDEWRPPKKKWKKEGDGRKHAFHPEELAKIFRACLAPKTKGERQESVHNRHEIYDLLRLMFLTAAREGEILYLQESQVSWVKREIHLVCIKGGIIQERDVPLGDTALKILDARRAHAPGFFSLGEHGMYRALDRIGEISGLPYGRNIEGGWIPYDLRHTAATYLESAGIPYSAIADLLGHKREDQTATYTNPFAGKILEGVRMLDDMLKSIDDILTGIEWKPELKRVIGG